MSAEEKLKAVKAKLDEWEMRADSLSVFTAARLINLVAEMRKAIGEVE